MGRLDKVEPIIFKGLDGVAQKMTCFQLRLGEEMRTDFLKG